MLLCCTVSVSSKFWALSLFMIQNLYSKIIEKKITAFTVIDCSVRKLFQDSWIQLLPSLLVLCISVMSWSHVSCQSVGWCWAPCHAVVSTWSCKGRRWDLPQLRHLITDRRGLFFIGPNMWCRDKTHCGLCGVLWLLPELRGLQAQRAYVHQAGSRDAVALAA